MSDLMYQDLIGTHRCTTCDAEVGGDKHLIANPCPKHPTAVCSRCKGPCIPTDSTPGYGVTPNGEKHCFACCAEDDKAHLRRGEPWVGYLRKLETLPPQFEISNWPGTLQIDVYSSKVSKGWAHGYSYPIVTFTFVFEGRRWYGRCAGDMDLARCKPYKRDTRK